MLVHTYYERERGGRCRHARYPPSSRHTHVPTTNHKAARESVTRLEGMPFLFFLALALSKNEDRGVGAVFSPSRTTYDDDDGPPPLRTYTFCVVPHTHTRHTRLSCLELRACFVCNNKNCVELIKNDRCPLAPPRAVATWAVVTFACKQGAGCGEARVGKYGWLARGFGC